MKLFQTTLGILGLVFGSSTLAAKKDANYAGPDGGYLVYSVGTIAIGMRFTFPYQRIALQDGSSADDWQGRISPKVGGFLTLKIKKPDFEGRQTGHVVVRRLPPGQYAVRDFQFSGQSPGGGGVHWSPSESFAMPFTIKPNQMTYIGSFMRAPSLGTPLQPVLGATGYFIVSNKADRDLPIARERQPEMGQEHIQVTDVDVFGSEALRTREPE